MIEMILALMMSWEKVFCQKRMAERAKKQALSQVCVLGRKTIARSWLAREKQGHWSSEYKLHSRGEWKEEELYEGVIEKAIEMSRGKFLVVGCDDTRAKKTGKKIEQAHWGRDAMSPPFHLNLEYGLRFLNISVIIQQHHKEVSARALPILLKEVTPIKKPGKRATPEEIKNYRAKIKLKNLSTETVAELKQMRKRVDSLGGEEKILAVAMDGSFANKTLFKAELERMILIARMRKDAKLCYEERKGKRIYSPDKFTPEQVRQDEKIEWKSARVFHSGQFRNVDYKEVKDVLWQRGAGDKKLRLFVIRPIPYRKTKSGKILYRQPAYLLTTDLETSAQELLQIYFDRWQIEVTHKELKQYFGLAHAQVRSFKSVSRQPSMTACTYSIFHLSAIIAFGSRRTDDFGKTPRYQRDKSRVSALDLIHFFRLEAINKPELFPFPLYISAHSLLTASSC